MKIIGIDIRLIGKGRTGDEAVFFHLTREVLMLDSINQYCLFTNEKAASALATLAVKLGCVGNPRVSIISLAGNRFLWNIVTLPWYLFRHRVDLYHTQYIAPLFLPQRTKLITHIHDISFRIHPEWIGWRDRLFLRLFIPRSLRRSARIVVPSLFTKIELEKQYPVLGERVVVVPNAASDAWSSPISAELLVALKQKYRLTDNYCIAVGTMQPRKNIIRLIEAFLSCEAILPDAKLVLAGNPSGYHVDPAIRTMALAPPPNICFTGYVNDDELRALVAGSRALFVPSLYEGFGIPILEGFESGVPVGVSDIPPFREVAGEAALFFDPLSLESMQKALYTLFIDRGAADELVKKGLVQKKRYSWRKSASALLQYYNHC